MQFRTISLACLAAAAPGLAGAQVTMKPDGQWRSLFTAGASLARGNTDSTSVSLNGDVVRLRDFDKWALYGRALYAKNDGDETANRFAAGGLYTRDITPSVFGFGQLDAQRDIPANLSSRLSAGAGLGLHLVRTEQNNWDVAAGLGYTRDRFDEPDIDDGVPRTSYSHADLLLYEESNHKLTETTTFRQKLSLAPNLKDRSDYLASFDAGISVAMTRRLALTATLTYRYDSRPSEGFEPDDTLFVTGVSYRFD